MNEATEQAVAAVTRMHIPASIAYTAASIYAFVMAVPGAVEDMTTVEAVVRIVETAILAIPQILGGVGLLMGGYLGYQIRRAKLDNQHELDLAAMAYDREDKRAALPRNLFAPTKQAKPDEDTKDLP